MKRSKHYKVREFLDKNDIRHNKIARLMGMTSSKFSQKINRRDNDFTLREASLLCYLLGVSMDEYFFENDFPKMGKINMEENN